MLSIKFPPPFYLLVSLTSLLKLNLLKSIFVRLQSLYLHGFSVRTSSHPQSTNMIVTVSWRSEMNCQWIKHGCLSLWWTGNLSMWYPASYPLTAGMWADVMNKNTSFSPPKDEFSSIGAHKLFICRQTQDFTKRYYFLCWKCSFLQLLVHLAFLMCRVNVASPVFPDLMCECNAL